MRTRSISAWWMAGALACLLGVPELVWGQPDPAQPDPAAVPMPAAGEAETPAEPAAEAAAPPVRESQEVLSARYKRFERLLLQVSEYLRKSDPDKADLLVRAVRMSKETQISGQFDSIVNLLKNDQLGDAVQRQDELVTHLNALLYLLQSESILERNQKEQERIKDLLKDLSKVIGKQKDVRAGTERRGDPDGLAERQEDVKGDAAKLVDKIDGQDAQRAREGQPGRGQPQAGDGDSEDGTTKDGEPKDGEPKDNESEDGKPSDGKPSDGKPSDGKPSNGKPSDGKPSDGKPSDGKPSDGKPGDEEPKDPEKDPEAENQKPEDGKPQDGKPQDGKPSDGKPSDGKPSDGKPSDGKPSDGKPSQGQPQQGQPQQGQPQQGQPQQGQQQQNPPGDPSQQPERTPGREEIEQAIRDMERAIEELKKQHHSDAARAQDEALRKLIAAKEKLEEILRQLREEERELLLAALEARFQKMLAMQIMVYKGTVSLDRTEKPAWQSEQFSRSRDLSQQENEIAIEAGKALTLLKAEGSSVAFPEAVEQLRADMLDVARRLDQFDTTRYTQDIERDIIEALEEVLEALQRELEKAREQREQPPPSEGQPADPALVDMLAELKMLRSLQHRINRRTRSIGRLIKTPEGQATEAALVQDLRMLSRRQAAVQQATYDLATGRNK